MKKTLLTEPRSSEAIEQEKQTEKSWAKVESVLQALLKAYVDSELQLDEISKIGWSVLSKVETDLSEGLRDRALGNLVRLAIESPQPRALKKGRRPQPKFLTDLKVGLYRLVKENEGLKSYRDSMAAQERVAQIMTDAGLPTTAHSVEKAFAKLKMD